MNIYVFKSPLQMFQTDAAWYFVTLPKNIAEEIKFLFSSQSRGWGSFPVKVIVGESEWRTSIFPDKSSNSYFLPIKKSVRLAEDLSINEIVEVEINMLVSL